MNITFVVYILLSHHVLVEVNTRTMICKVSVLISVCRHLYHADSALAIHTV